MKQNQDNLPNRVERLSSAENKLSAKNSPPPSPLPVGGESKVPSLGGFRGAASANGGRGIQNLLLATVSIIATLLMLEIGVRLIPQSPPMFENYGDTYVCSPTMGWRGRSDYAGMISREEYRHELRFNNEGMHDSDHALDKPADAFRILWAGDSFAQAVQVDETETAHQQLENLLNTRLDSRQFEVISAGVMGWGTGQSLLHYREVGRAYQPDLVLLLFFMGNDVNNNLPGHALTIDGFNCFAPYFAVCDGQFDPTARYYVPGLPPAWGSCPTTQQWASAGLRHLQQNSRLFAQIEPLLLSWQPRRSYGQDFALPFTALYLPDESAEVEYGWAVTEGILRQFKREVEADGARFGVVIVGPREVVWLAQLTEAQLSQFLTEQPAFQHAEFDRPNQRLTTFLTDAEIAVIDLQPLMIDYINQTDAQLYLPIDRHWTVDGNRVAAEMIFGWLTESQLVEE